MTDIPSLVESVPHRAKDDAHVCIPTGWRLLNVGEEIIDGDKHWRASVRDWEHSTWIGSKVTPQFDTYIRRIPDEPLATEVTRLRAELETERRKVEVATEGLQEIENLPAWTSDSAEQIKYHIIAKETLDEIAALTPSEKGEL